MSEESFEDGSESSFEDFEEEVDEALSVKSGTMDLGILFSKKEREFGEGCSKNAGEPALPVEFSEERDLMSLLHIQPVEIKNPGMNDNNSKSNSVHTENLRGNGGMEDYTEKGVAGYK